MSAPIAPTHLSAPHLAVLQGAAKQGSGAKPQETQPAAPLGNTAVQAAAPSSVPRRGRLLDIIV